MRPDRANAALCKHSKSCAISIKSAQLRSTTRPHQAVACSRLGRAGFTLTELLVSIGIVVVLAGLALSVLARSRSAAQSMACVANLHAIAQGLIQYAQDNDNLLPDPQSMDRSWETCLHAYLPNPETFRCSADQEVFPILGSSYDWRDTAVAQTTLAGRMLSDVKRSNAVLAFESLPGWHAKGKMNAAFLDGSTQVMDQEACLADLQLPLRDASATEKP